MSKNSNVGGSSNMRTQIQNLWQAINTIETGGGGTGNMSYNGDGSIGTHYKQSSVDGKTCTNSILYENTDDNSFHFGSFDLKSIGDITADTFIKNGGTSSDFLKGDGSIDSNPYLTPSDLLNYVPKVGDSTITGDLTANSFIKTGGTSSQFLKADGSSDSSRISIVDTNVAIGTGSLIANTSGVYNMALGQDALNANTEGNFNTAVGGAALLSNTSGANNLAIGVSALQKNVSGLRNVAVGVVGLYENTTGNDNVAIGENALRNNTEGQGNTSCGVQSMMTNTTGSFNTGLGYGADVVSDNLVNATAIGFNAKVNSNNTIQLGNENIITVNTSGNITANSFVKNAGTNIQYLMADGSTLTQSANSGNSNFYLFNSGTSQSTTPPSGFITYNNATQSSATIIYISHLTRDNIDIEVYFKQITTITDVYIQDENTSVNFIQFNITGTPTITPEAQVAIPVLVRGTPGTTDFANGHNVIISFFTNGLEVDTRLSDLETKTQFQTIVSGNTNFSSGIAIGNNYINTTQTVFNASGQLVSKNYVDTAIGIGTNNTTERWVNSYIGVDTNSGSVMKPLLTINAGFGNSAQYPLKLNIRGAFTALQTLTGTNSNLQITTTDGWEAQQSTLSATVITSGALTRLKMSGFTISTGTSAVLTIGDTLGRHAFSNMQFVSSNATPITFTSGFTNWCDFQDCDFGGLSVGGITLPALTGTAILRLYNCGLLNLTTNTGWTVYISGSTVLTTSSNLATGTIIQLPFNSFNAVLTSNPTWSSLPVGNYINMVTGGLTGVIGTPSLGCCVIKIATGIQVVSLGYNQLPSSINVLNGVSLSYDTFVRTKGAVGWVVVEQCLPLVGGTMAGTINTNNNLITGLQRLTFNTSSTAIGSNAGLTGQLTNSVAVGSGCGQTSQGLESLAIGYNSGQSNQLGSSVAVGRGCGQTSQGALCVALGNVAGTTSQSTASIAIGNQAGATTQGGASESCVAIGNFTGNDNQGGFSVAIGKEAGRVTQGANCVAIGNQAGKNSQSPNSIVLNASGAVLDSTTTGLFIKPVRNEFNTNTILYNSTSGELTYSERGSYLPELTSDYKPNIWYYITTTSTFIGGIFTTSTQITAIGGTLTQIATANTNWRTRKSGRINCPTVSVADGQRSGFIGTATFPAIYSGSGWLFSFDFSITDTNASATAVTRMFVGFGITTIAPGLSSTVAINTLQNMIGIGHDSGDTVLSFYSRGPAVGTANGNKIATTFSCATPSTKIFTATFYSPTNSDDIMIKLYDQETRTSAYQTFTLGGTLTPISTSPLIPVWVRAMATGGGTTNSAQLGLNGFKWYTL